MNIDVLRRLTHTVTVTQVTGQTDTGEPAYTDPPVDDVPCFIERRQRRVLNDQGVEIPTDYDITFFRNQTLTLGAMLTGGLRLDGTTVLTSAKIVLLDDVEHPLDNNKMRIVAAKESSG